MTVPVPSDVLLERTIAQVRPPADSAEAVQAHLDRLTKPPGSLGRLESLALALARIYGDPPPALDEVAIYVLAADHGVAHRGVSAYPPEVTAQMCANFSAGGAAINVLARVAGARVVVADLGVAADLSHLRGVLDRKIARGTADLSEGPAMSRARAVDAVAAGIRLFDETRPRPDLVAIGEMGIGNTTAAAAVVAGLTGVPATGTVGPGTGVDAARLAHKREVVRTAVSRIEDDADPIEVLRQVGGFEIAAMAGVALGAAREGRAVLVDGFISGAAALVAGALCPDAKAYLLASHLSPEPGHAVALSLLGLEPILDLDLRLGEGSGAALAVPLVRSAAAILREMATFESAGISGPDPSPASRPGEAQ